MPRTGHHCGMQLSTMLHAVSIIPPVNLAMQDCLRWRPFKIQIFLLQCVNLWW